MTEKHKIYTIGHSNHQLEDFLKLLEEQGIEQLVDIRSAPYSKYSPHFNKTEIKKFIEDKGIVYFYLGNMIGGRPSNEEYYHEGNVIYHLVEKDQKYLEGIDKLTNLIRDKKTVLMCSEEDPNRCHRHKLITPTLKQKGFTVLHIRGNGVVEDVKDRQTTLF